MLETREERNFWYDYSLEIAAGKGDLEKVKGLIEQGVDVERYNRMAMFYASRNGHTEVFQYLSSQIRFVG